MQFLFGDRELILNISDLLTAPVDVIVNPANGGLSHGGGVAGQIARQGGDVIQTESDIFIKEHGTLEIYLSMLYFMPLALRWVRVMNSEKFNWQLLGVCSFVICMIGNQSLSPR